MPAYESLTIFAIPNPAATPPLPTQSRTAPVADCCSKIHHHRALAPEPEPEPESQGHNHYYGLLAGRRWPAPFTTPHHSSRSSLVSGRTLPTRSVRFAGSRALPALRSARKVKRAPHCGWRTLCHVPCLGQSALHGRWLGPARSTTPPQRARLLFLSRRIGQPQPKLPSPEERPSFFFPPFPFSFFLLMPLA